ncbi:uncharacterized protein TNIN_231032, partial [Trichonephila inaurata madagascariensis]
DADISVENKGPSSEKLTRNSRKNKLSHDPLPEVCDVCKKNDASISCSGVCSKFFHLTCLGRTSVPEIFKCSDCSLKDADISVENKGPSSEKLTRNSRKNKLSHDPLPEVCDVCKKNDASISTSVPEIFKCSDCSLKDADISVENKGPSSEKLTHNSRKIKLSHDPLPEVCDVCKKNDANIFCSGVCSKFFHLTCLGRTSVPENFKCPECCLRYLELFMKTNGTSSEKPTQNSKKIKLSHEPLLKVCNVCKKSDADISCLGICSKSFHSTCLGMMNVPEKFKCPDCSFSSADHIIQSNRTSFQKLTQNSKKIKLSCDPLPKVCNVCKKKDPDFPCLGTCSKFFHLTCLGKTSVPENFKCPDCCLKSADPIIQNNGTSSEKLTRKPKKIKLSCDPLPKVCNVCKKNDPNISCLGACSKFFHMTCLGKTSVPENFKCSDCSLSAYTCFVCEKSNGFLVQCSFINCTKHYHAYCINQYECTNSTKNICPLHTCLTCYRENSNSPLSHTDGELLCCKACPTSVHQSCLKIPISSEDYICSDCLKRKYLLYGMIVWGKFACFRWWPAQIIHPSYLPNNVKKQTHYDGEFAIRYYGTHNYSWTHSGRVYPFTESHKNYPRTKINKLGEEFEIGLKEAAEAFDEYEENRKSMGLLGKRIKDYKHLRCLVKLAGSGSKSSICQTTICKRKASALHLQSGLWICPLHFCFICKKSSSIFCVLCSTSYCWVCWSLESNSKPHTYEVCKVKFDNQKNV